MAIRERIKDKVLRAYEKRNILIIFVRHTRERHTGEVEEVDLKEGYLRLRGGPRIYFGQIESVFVAESGKIKRTKLKSGV